MAKQEIRTVNGNRYLYYTHYQKGDRVVVYCGRADDNDAQLMGSKLELKQTVASIEKLQERRRELRDGIVELNKIKRGEGGGARTSKKRKTAANAGSAAKKTEKAGTSKPRPAVKR